MSSNKKISGLEIDLLEFERLRQEIDNRTQISNNLILGCIAAFGAGIPFIIQNPDVLLGLAFVATLLWLLWMDQTEQIYKCALYIGTQLSPKYKNICTKPFFWEEFLRIINQNNQETIRLLYPETLNKNLTIHVRPTRHIMTFTLLIFCGLAGTALSLYIFLVIKDPLWNFILYWISDSKISFDPIAFARCLGFLVICVLYGYGITNFFSFRRSLVGIDEAILMISSTVRVDNATSVTSENK
jgi:hypothetical protein